MKWKLATVAVVADRDRADRQRVLRRVAPTPRRRSSPRRSRAAPSSASVAASGTLEAVTTVQVGTQISGTVQALYADFNSIVKKGQVIARLDPSLVQAEIDQARAALVRAEAEVERLECRSPTPQTKPARARELAGRELIPRNELETAE